jgi:hypothetical protein
MKRFNFKNEASVKKQLEMYASIVGQNEPISINYLK